MLSPVSFRICCIAAMAPALTEAASQAESFSLPHSPASSTICNSNPTSPPTADRTVANGSSKDLTRRFQHRLLWDSVNLAALANVKLLRLREGFHDANAAPKAMNGKDSMGLTNGNDSLHSPPATPTVATSPSQLHKESTVPSPVTFPPDRPQSPRESPITDSLEELLERARARRNVLERRSERLHRRIRRLQLRQVLQHSNTQLGGFLEHQQKSLGVPCLMPQAQRLLHRKLREGVDLKAELLLQNEDVKSLSTAALVNLVRKLEESSAQGAPDTLAKLPESDRTECDRVSGTLRTTLSHQERAVDSDATESSSGGESGDEIDMRHTVDTLLAPAQTDPTSHRRPSIRQTAAWSWALERAAVATRWTWLQAQVADLEFRIRQQNDVCRQLRLAKGRVRLEGDPPQQAAVGLRDDLTTCKRPPGDDIDTAIPKTTTANGMVPGSAADTAGCSRIRPLINLRKRKVVSSDVALTLPSASALGRKAARLGGGATSTVQCDCRSMSSSQALPCPMCAGRYNVLRPLDQDTMPERERIALLDPAFHPVLSFRSDLPLSLHFEVLLRTGELQKLALRASASLRKKSRLAQVSGLSIDQARKKNRKLAHSAAQSLLSSAKMRKHHSEKKRAYRRHVDGNILDDEGFRRTDGTYSLMSMKHRERQRSLSTASSGSSKAASPVPSPAPSMGDNISQHAGQRSILQDVLRRRRGENAFDINNIVIPYSLASATRVERLPYKEILTPKWRELSEEELNSPQPDPLEAKEEKEDTSDEAFAARHQVCEEEERQRFAGLLSKAALVSQTPHHNSLHYQPPRGGRSRLRGPEEILDVADSPVTSPAEEDWYEVPPYELRCFPLGDAMVHTMVESSPHLRPATPPPERPPTPTSPPPPCPSSQVCTVAERPPAVIPPTRLSSPVPASPTSSLSSLPPGEDPNDPEWTVVNSEKRQNLVLRLAKR